MPRPDHLEAMIHFVRGRRVMLDSDLARLYGVSTRRLNEQVRRNAARFPDDFMLTINLEESQALRSQNATLKKGRGQHRKFKTLAFTEQGVAMLSSVLRSPKAVHANIAIMRAFVRSGSTVTTGKSMKSSSRSSG